MPIPSGYTSGQVVQAVPSLSAYAVTSSTRPASPFDGQIISETDTDSLQIYKGSAWGSASGLVYLTTATASASAALNINSCFSSTYTNYRIIYNFTGSTTLELQMRLRLVTTDYSGTEYTDYGYGMGSGGAFNLQHVNTTQFTIGYVNTSEPIWGSMDIYSPNVAVKTNFSNLSGIAASIYENGRVNTTTQYDGFSLLASTGNITGTATIYGYSKS
jgi:hypothetical protein